MNHAELSTALRRMERDLPALQRNHDAEFRPVFDAHVANLSSQAEDPDDVVYVMERADAMLGDLGID